MRHFLFGVQVRMQILLDVKQTSLTYARYPGMAVHAFEDPAKVPTNS